MEFSFESLRAWVEGSATLIASAAGAACSAWITKTESTRDIFICILLGILASSFLSDPIYRFLPLLGENTTCFLTGFFGLNACAALLKPIKRFGETADLFELLKQVVGSIVDRFAGSKKE